MSQENNNTKNKICPTCGTRLSENATRCLVCGSNFADPKTEKTKTSTKQVQSPRLPEVTLSLPLAIGMVIIILAIGAAIVFAVLNGTGRVVEPTVTITPSLTPTSTMTPTVTLTPTQIPTSTPLPPLEYTIQSNDTCISIAYAFGVSVNSIILLNKLPVACDTLYETQILLIPQPTPTPPPLPTNTLSAAEATEAACDKYEYTVTENDTLSSIAQNYNVSIETLKDYNSITGDVVYSGRIIQIPLCKRNPTPGPTPTATPPPPYAAANLLLPADGAAFTAANDTIVLQWSSVGTLREQEAYAVTIEDITEGKGRKLVDYVTDTKFIIPATFRPNDNIPHVIRWFVIPVRQSGTGADGNPIYQTAGAASAWRDFTWWASGSVTPTP